MADVQQLAGCISCHAWNKDRTKVALCPDNAEVHIYSKQGGAWKKEGELKEHDHLVTGIDWAPNSNNIVTCSQDRNAYVWQFKDGKWNPTLVILRINRAATAVKWSPNEQKFAVASGAKTVSICYFEAENDWWISKHIKNHKSTVTSVAWHPNNIYLATGSSDFKARIFSAHVKGLDERPQAGPFGDAAKLAFGNCLAEYTTAGWVHDVAFSPSGNILAFVSHDSTICFVNINNSAELIRVPLTSLPFKRCLFLHENAVVAAGYDCNPALFTGQGGAWKFAKWIDEEKAAGGAKQVSQTAAARNMWADKVDRGTAGGEAVQTKLNTKHQNAISYFGITGGQPSKVTSFSTTGVDGKLVTWSGNW